ncbi:helix-turn-helix domain-containing protein [Streptomyces viridiviolaceus]|uniref:Helix-turn-helix domain-containing protein n=1 Tax=Streptomyces viridiviolaceus TaxID=68282 RepID=A0ABW2DWI2_9ACTN|nr:helix-turn-helix domain-containing protein [Streptomyces viridiviolaceus]
MEQVNRELDGAPALLFLADPSACIVDARYANRSVHQEITGLGMTVGVRAGEDQLGTNALGTPAATGRDVLVRGSDHVLPAFSAFTCYGHPVVHPVTRRLEGVLSIGCRSPEEHPLLRPLARRVVQDIEDRLQRDTSHVQRLLVAAFQTAARRRGRAVMVIGQGLVLSTPPALDLLQPADHENVRARAQTTSSAGETVQRLTLGSGRTVRLRCRRIDGTEGVLVHIVPDQDTSPHEPGPGTAWPLLIVGEPGSGRTTAARRAAGFGARTLDAADVLGQGEPAWAKTVGALLQTDGPAVIIENLHLLSEQLGMLLTRCLRVARRAVVLTSSPGDHLDGVHAPVVAECAARQDLVPLRRRRHEIPALAQKMLTDIKGPGRLRLTSETLHVLADQPWPGNLSELRRVVRTLTEVRSAGDIIPSDLPVSHRGTAPPASPFLQAEREIIVAAIDAAGGNKVQAARALGMSRSTLYNRMRALRIH